MSGSGPPYPRYAPGASPGGNAIGSFVIGSSPIGTIQAFDLWVTIISQYSNSPILTAMIESFNAAMDPTELLDDFYDLIWNVLTAEGYGLDVWGRIVGVDRAVNVSQAGEYLGFQEPGNDWTGFNQGIFYSGPVLTNNILLTDAQFRPVVLAKAATNIWDGSIPGLNTILLALFKGRGQVYAADNQNMSITYTFDFALTALDSAIISGSGALPQPTGVVINTTTV